MTAFNAYAPDSRALSQDWNPQLVENLLAFAHKSIPTAEHRHKNLTAQFGLSESATRGEIFDASRKALVLACNLPENSSWADFYRYMADRDRKVAAAILELCGQTLSIDDEISRVMAPWCA